MRKAIFAAVATAGLTLCATTVSDVRVVAADGFGGDTSSVLARCQTKPGSTYDPVTVSRDVTSLKNSGEYQDISASAEKDGDDVAVTFRVVRKMRFQGPPVVKGAEFYGASRIASEAGLKDGQLYGDADLATAAEKVRALYVKKHFPGANVTATPKILPDSNVCTVTFLVDEGSRMKTGEYAFPGAKSIEESELREAIDVFPWWNPRGWFGDEPTSDDQLAQAAEKLKTLYADRGFLDVEVAQPERAARGDGKGVITFAVEEGPRYTVGDVSVKGVTQYPIDKVMQLSRLPKTGDVAGAKSLADAAHRISIVVGSGAKGLADTKTEYKYIPREDSDSVVDIVFDVKEGVPVVIDHVQIVGNDYTKDGVIRREIQLGPGDKMLADRAERSKRRLENLDYFQRVRYYLKESPRGKNEEGAEYRDLVYEVEEKNTGSFMVGVGASSVDSVYVSAEISQSNFDIFAPGKLFRGAGQKGRLYVQAGPRIQTYEASVTEPHLFDRLLQLTVEGYRRQRWYDEYDVIRSGAGVTLDYPVKFWPTWDPFGRFGVRLGAEYIELDDMDGGYWMYKKRVVSLKEKGGEDDRYGDAFEGVARIFWSRDTRDSYRVATSGSRTQLFLDLAGGDNEYWRLGFNHRSYFNVWKRYGHILSIGLRAETIDAFSDDVPIYNRMFLGGPRSVRGVEYRHVSPMARKIKGKDPDGELSHTYTPWGGQTLFCANFEYTIPIVKMLRIAAFTDLGAVGEDEFDFDVADTFAWTVGLGLRIDIPMFPIRLDFATPIEKPDEADKEVFSFTIGYDF